MWRLVTQRIATLQELETSWSLCQLANANDALDALAEAEAELRRQ